MSTGASLKSASEYVLPSTPFSEKSGAESPIFNRCASAGRSDSRSLGEAGFVCAFEFAVGSKNASRTQRVSSPARGVGVPPAHLRLEPLTQKRAGETPTP